MALKRTTGQSGRVRKIMIVAVARKLAIALWRYLEHGLVPQGAIRHRHVAHSSSQTSTRFWPVKWLGISCQPLTFL